MRLKVGKISYINSVPLFCANSNLFEMVEDYPARLNRLAEKRELDVSLISRWIYPQIEKDYKVIPEFCIGGDGEIMSVEIFSKKPLESLKNGTLFITAETGTSSKAFGYLVAKKYGFNLLSLERVPFEEADAVLLIGNAALAFSNPDYPYKYDLGKMWREVAGTKMLYAVAVARRDIFESARLAISEYFDSSLRKFDEERAEQIKEVARRFELERGTSISESLLEKYYSKLIYKFSEKDFVESFNYVTNLYRDGLV